MPLVLPASVRANRGRDVQMSAAVRCRGEPPTSFVRFSSASEPSTSGAAPNRERWRSEARLPRICQNRPVGLDSDEVYDVYQGETWLRYQ